MKYSIALFDLDGTIIDSSEGITKSVAYAMDKHGIVHGGYETLKAFIGPPLKEQFMKVCGVDEAKGTELVNAYREYYAVTGIFECSVYDGIQELLANMKKNGYKILLATSKPEKFARIILEHLSLDIYFDCIAGSNLNNTRTDKAAVIEYALECCGLSDDAKNKAVMIGDSIHDVNGAAKYGIDAIAVTYGFGNSKELKNSNAVFVCESRKALNEYLCR